MAEDKRCDEQRKIEEKKTKQKKHLGRLHERLAVVPPGFLVLHHRRQQALAHVLPAEVDAQQQHQQHRQRGGARSQAQLRRLARNVKGGARDGGGQQRGDAREKAGQPPAQLLRRQRRPRVQERLAQRLELVDGALVARHANLLHRVEPRHVRVVGQAPVRPRGGAAAAGGAWRHVKVTRWRARVWSRASHAPADPLAPSSARRQQHAASATPTACDWSFKATREQSKKCGVSSVGGSI